MKEKAPAVYPVIPLRDIVVFPRMVTPLFIGRSKSIKSIEQVNASKSSDIVLVAQKNASVDFPKETDLYTVGVVARILQTLKLPDGTLKILVEAKKRVRLLAVQEANNFEALVEDMEMLDYSQDDLEMQALRRSIIDEFNEYAKYNTVITNETLEAANSFRDLIHLSDVVASNVSMSVEKKQLLLELDDLKEKMKKLLVNLAYEIGLLKVEKKIRDDVKKQMDKTQKDYFLNEQLKAIHKELGEAKNGKTELDELEEKIKKTALSKEALEKAMTELNRLKTMNSVSAEAAISRNYLDHLLALPWGKETKLKHDIKSAEKLLNKEHYGLQKIKDSILEFLSVQKRTQSMKGPILCFVGPPGVGKTSLAKSIAAAMGRKFVKFSLGGVRDEAEIRGHRKTYLGSMPGKIMYLLRKAESSNALMLLDELDKLSADYRGSPASALLEVLDPEQNSKFVDHYLEVEYDLSKVMFIATANSTDMHPALLDRMEIINIAGYTEDEKLAIAKNYLLRKQYKDNKLTKKELQISESALRDIVRYYTHEAGVRNLEREIAKIARKVVREIEQEQIKSVIVAPDKLEKYLGVRKFKYSESEKEDLVGVTTGLAYTSVGGDLLSIEAVLVPGAGKIKATGKLGNVMQESAQAAYSYFCSQAAKYGVDIAKYKKQDIHLHVPEGAVPKDGPSAGIAMFTSIISAMTKIPVKKSVAMTGEITLSGRVLPIGGLKEKLLAAHRGGIKTVLIPAENEKDLAEIPKNITDNLKIITVQTAQDVVKWALVAPVTNKTAWENKIVVPEDAPQFCLITH